MASQSTHTSSLGECENDKAINNRNGVSPDECLDKCFSLKISANSHQTTDQPDSVAHIQEQCEEQEEIYVQVTVRSKKLRTQKDGTIILSPISESIVS